MKTNAHILIIDDEAVLRQTMARILQREGFNVTTASNGTDALKLITDHFFDLVYLDIRMPDINGMDLLKIVHEKLPDLPVILFTAQPDLNSAMEAVRHGAIDYLLKPLKPQTVIERTHAILDARQNERRKREIQRQIDTLQAELHALEGMGEDQKETQPEPVSAGNDRYVTCGELTLDLYAHRATMNDESINIPPTTLDYLLVLMRHSPDVVDFQTLVAEAQGYETDLREAQELSKWHIHHIRQAIESDSHKPSRVINIRGTGYRLVMN